MRQPNSNTGLLNLHTDSNNCFSSAGCLSFNDAVLTTAIGTAAVRADRVSRGAKLVNTHQNVTVHSKGARSPSPDDMRRFGINPRCSNVEGGS